MGKENRLQSLVVFLQSFFSGLSLSQPRKLRMLLGGQPAEDLYFAFSSFEGSKQFKKPHLSLVEASELCNGKGRHICLQDMHFSQKMGLN